MQRKKLPLRVEQIKLCEKCLSHGLSEEQCYKVHGAILCLTGTNGEIAVRKGLKLMRRYALSKIVHSEKGMLPFRIRKVEKNKSSNNIVTMLVLIKGKKDGSFQSNGETVPYFWYKALRKDDEVSIEFGSRNGGYEEGQELDLNIEKVEGNDGRKRYKEVK